MIITYILGTLTKKNDFRQKMGLHFVANATKNFIQNLGMEITLKNNSNYSKHPYRVLFKYHKKDNTEVSENITRHRNA